MIAGGGGSGASRGDPAPGIQIRALGPDDDYDQLFDLRTRAFGPATPLQRAAWLAQASHNIAAGRYLAAFDGARMAAAACFHDMTQWWLGRGVPAAGVANVAVAPEDRGIGIGRALMTELLAHIAACAYPLSVLYPATSAIYRSLGWELAGICYEAEIPARSLRTITPEPGAPRGGLGRVAPGDSEAVRAVHCAVHAGARDCGPLTWDEPSTRQWLDSDELFSYLGADGFVAYRWRDGNDELLVERAIAGSHATTRDIWSLLASSSSVARTVRARVSPAEPFGIMMREPDTALASVHPWMLRVVDAPAAVAGRGFPAGLELSVPLRLRDAGRPGNAGDWTLTVGGGKGALEPSRTAAAAALSMDVRGFAALYAGTTVPVLRRSGLAGGGNPGDDVLFDAAFAAQPFCLDTF